MLQNRSLIVVKTVTAILSVLVILPWIVLTSRDRNDTLGE
jgi:hypothetical protein